MVTEQESLPEGLHDLIEIVARRILQRREVDVGLKPLGPLMRMVLVIAAIVSIAFGLIAVGRAWYAFRPLTDEERSRLRQEGN